MKIDFFQFQRKFSTDQRCYQFLFNKCWPEGFRCSRCDHDHYSFHSVRILYLCKQCKYQASVTAGTVLHKTRTPFRKWFWMICLLTNNKTGSSQLYFMRLRALGCYKTAWNMNS